MIKLTIAQGELAATCMGLARTQASIARRRLPTLGDEAESAAMMAVVLAMRSFNPADGRATLETYVKRCIRGEIGRAIRWLTWKGRQKRTGHVRVSTTSEFYEVAGRGFVRKAMAS
jgi:DNA-directed RNA polymerase specialized sigma subunit